MIIDAVFAAATAAHAAYCIVDAVICYRVCTTAQGRRIQPAVQSAQLRLVKTSPLQYAAQLRQRRAATATVQTRPSGEQSASSQ